MELIFEDSYKEMVCNIYIKEKRGNQIVIIGYDGKLLIEQVLPYTPEKVDVKPLLSIPLFMKDELIRSFVNEGAKNNLRTENENLLKGKLEATEFHLKDMREIALKLINKNE